MELFYFELIIPVPVRNSGRSQFLFIRMIQLANCTKPCDVPSFKTNAIHEIPLSYRQKSSRYYSRQQTSILRSVIIYINFKVPVPWMWMKCPHLFSVQAVILCRHFLLCQNRVFSVGPVTNLIFLFSSRFHKTDTESHLMGKKRKRRRKRRKMRLNNYLHCLRYLLFIQHYFFVQNYFWNKKL